MRKFVVLLIAGLFMFASDGIQSADADSKAKTKRIEVKEAGFSLAIPGSDWAFELENDPKSPPLVAIYHLEGDGMIFVSSEEEKGSLAEIAAKMKKALIQDGVKVIDVKIEKNPDRASLSFDFKADGNDIKAKLVFMRNPAKPKMRLAFLGMAKPDKFRDLLLVLDAIPLSLKKL